MIRSLSAFCAAAALAFAQKPENVLVVVNEQSALSKLAGEYYARKRTIPAANVCRIKITDAEEVPRDTYNRGIARPVSACLAASKNRIFYIVTTAGVPLKIDGAGGQGGDQASVDSELTLLYRDRRGQPHETRGMVPNPFFNSTLPFDPDRFAMYLVTRLAGYDFADIRGLVDRSLAARNTGRFVIDMKEGDDSPGEDWLRDAAIRLPTERTVFNQDKQVLYTCAVTVTVTGVAGTGVVTNSVTINSVEGGTGNTSQATIAVGDIFSLDYMPNLAQGDSVVNLTNTGASGANLCANVFVFSPDEQLVSCCACPITPNALASLSARADLISNTLTPAVPGAIVVKLIASQGAGTCNPGSITPATLAPGLEGWGSKLHNTPSGLQVSETQFVPGSLSLAEFNRAVALCGFLQGNGSGYGICKSCRSGALGGVKQ